MPRLARIVLLLLVPALSGCLTAETLIRLNADGTGTLEQTILLNVKTMEELPMLIGGALGGDVKAKGRAKTSGDPSEMFSEARVRAEAEKLGGGVRLVSSTPIARGDMQGARMVFAFDDVNALSVEPMSGVAGVAATGKSGAEPLDLRLAPQPNGTMLLTIRLGEGEKAGKSSAPPAKASSDDMPPGMEEMFAQLLDGFRVAIDVEVDGTIVQTSSPYVSGSRVTLVEMDLGALLKDKDGLARLLAMQPGTSAGVVAAKLKDVKGIKVNDSPVTIAFTAR